MDVEAHVDPWEQQDQEVDPDEIVQRVAALDIGKAEVVCAVRLPGRSGRRRQLVRTFSTMTRQLLVLADWLTSFGVTRVVMEATGDYWRPPFYVLEGVIADTWLVNAKDVKNLPSRPKTDVIDAVWVCKLAERGMLRPSFVPPPPIRDLRALTRYRANLVAVRTAEKQRVEKLLEDAQIKLSVIASDIFGVSGRQMLAALIAGERDPNTLAQMAHGRMRPKINDLREAFIGRFDQGHAFLLATMLEHIDSYDRDLTDLDARIATAIGPFAAAVARLCEIPGVKETTARVIVSEIGVDMTRFPTSGHLTSWARCAPRVKESAGHSRGNAATGHGDKYLARVLGEAAVSVGGTNTFLGERYRRIAKRRGKKKAVVAIGRSILVIVWHLLSDEHATFHDLGPDWYDKHVNHDRKMRNHIRELQALGYRVTLEPIPA